MQIRGAVVRNYEHRYVSGTLADYVVAALYADGGEDGQETGYTYLVTLEEVFDDEYAEPDYQYCIHVWNFDTGAPADALDGDVDLPGVYAQYGIVECDYIDESVDVDDYDRVRDYLCDILEDYLGY